MHESRHSLDLIGMREDGQVSWVGDKGPFSEGRRCGPFLSQDVSSLGRG